MANILSEKFLIYFMKNFIVNNENKKDIKIPNKIKKLKSILCLNKSFIPKMLAPNRAGIER